MCKHAHRNTSERPAKRSAHAVHKGVFSPYDLIGFLHYFHGISMRRKADMKIPVPGLIISPFVEAFSRLEQRQLIRAANYNTFVKGA